MKKFVLGCLGLLVVLGIAAAIGGYYFVYRPLRGYATSIAQFKEIPDLDRQIRNTSEFTPPGNGELTPARVDRYMNVQHAIQQKLGARVDELDAKYKALEKANNSHPSLSEGINAMKDLAGLVVDAKRVQVDALNAEGFSKSEYQWTQRTIYEALGVPVTTGGLANVIEKAAQGAVKNDEHETPEPATTAGEVPQRNRELVEPHRKELEKNVGLAFFGL